MAKVEILRHPTEEDWRRCKFLAMNTIGKSDWNGTVTDEWKRKMLKAEHRFFYELARYFDTCDAVVSVTVPWFFNRGGEYKVTINRDGSWVATNC